MTTTTCNFNKLHANLQTPSVYATLGPHNSNTKWQYDLFVWHSRDLCHWILPLLFVHFFFSLFANNGFVTPLILHRRHAFFVALIRCLLSNATVLVYIFSSSFMTNIFDVGFEQKQNILYMIVFRGKFAVI